MEWPLPCSWRRLCDRPSDAIADDRCARLDALTQTINDEFSLSIRSSQLENHKATIDCLRGESELSTWLYGIAMTPVRNYLNRLFASIGSSRRRARGRSAKTGLLKLGLRATAPRCGTVLFARSSPRGAC